MSGAPDSLLARTARGAGWVIAWRWGMRGLGLVSTLILVRLLVPADFGLIALATGFMQTIDGMLSVGLEEAVIRERRPDRDFYDTAFTLNLLRGLLIGGIVAAGAFPAAAWFGDPRLAPVLLVIAAMPVIEGLANIGAVDFRRDLAFQKEFAMMVLPKLGGIVTAVAAAFLLHSYVAMLCGIAVNRSLRSVMSYVMHPYRPRLTLRAWRAMMGYSLWTWLLSLAVLLRDRSDTLLLGRLTNPAALGAYSVGAEIAALPTTDLIEPLCRASFSGFAAARHLGMAVRETFLRLVGSAAVLTLPAGVGLSLTAGPLVRLAFGPGWDAAVPVLQILALAGTLMVFGQLSLHLLSAHALLGRLVGLSLFGGVLRVALLAVLIPPFGLTGAAAAAAAAIAVEQLSTVVTAMRRFRVPIASFLRHIWRPMLATVVMAAVLWGCGFGWRPGGDAGDFAESVVLGAAVYGSVLILAWNSAGRPDGGERDLLSAVRQILPFQRS